jgi:outer membrane protein OmpA-like peptidoglycan-associated protein
MRHSISLALTAFLVGNLLVRLGPAIAAGGEIVAAERIAAQLTPRAEIKILTADQIAFQLSQRKSIAISGQVVRRVDLPTVTFEYNSDKLTPQAQAQLDELARALNYEDFKGIPFRVSGHTDATGSERYNQGLSERRARAAMSYLASGHSLDPAKIEWVGLGESEPDPQYGPTAPEQRRVAIELTPGG